MSPVTVNEDYGNAVLSVHITAKAFYPLFFTNKMERFSFKSRHVAKGGVLFKIRLVHSVAVASVALYNETSLMGPPLGPGPINEVTLLYAKNLVNATRQRSGRINEDFISVMLLSRPQVR